MKFSVALPGNHHIPTPPDWVLRLQAPDFQRIVAAVDDLGYDGVSASEHIVMPLFEVPRLGGHWLHALTSMAFVAGATKRVRVDFTVLVLPYHHPVELAKVVSTLDVLSGGRVNVSVGVGHAEREFEVLNVPFRERGRMTDEALEVMKLCWSTARPVFKGRYYEISDVAFEPLPVQQPRPPIYIGGNSEAALRRAARHEGWYPNPVAVAATDIGPLLEYIRQQPEFAGKADTFRVYFGIGGFGFGNFEGQSFATATATQRDALRDRLREAVETLRVNGVTCTSVPTLATSGVDEYIDSLRWFAEEVGAFPAR